MSDILTTIIQHKRGELKGLKEEFAKLDPTMRPRETLFFPPAHSFILTEIKPASPSEGRILPEKFSIGEIATTYVRAGADAISVLADRKFFQGDPCFTRELATSFEVPLLFKEFIIDPWQIDLAYNLGADIILLIASILTEKELAEFYNIARGKGLQVIVEVHNREDIIKALNINPEIIGINNRNLRTFKTTIETTLELMPFIPEEITIISESGIGTPDDIKILSRKGVKGFLIGTSILKSSNYINKIKELKNAMLG